ncbi:papain-like cysteine protease family protein [Kluyvera ascorbata]|uniref:Papain-like cysteine protease family protein n=1 Tax=Kluyvera ascorbata TaxID=51288 RepID=A0AB35X211_9ENTR|nr:papain-like cysteine protease family protein [Kluyvera ascorbata]MDT8701171.1 papain-like cysteine protease family protein [Kluyvera ascorbata]
MNRRSFLSMLLYFAAIRSTKSAVMSLGPMTPQGQPMKAYVAHPTHVTQSCPFWCWAASIAMIFEAHGHSIDQSEIVRSSFNSNIAFCTKGNTSTIGNDLSKPWVDSQGVSFQSQVVAAYDIFNNILAINNNIIINELANDRPLLYANRSHAMVVVSVDYFMTPMGPDVRAVGVLDPWPESPKYHLLNVQEMRPAHMGGDMTFLAAVQTT